VLAPHKNVKKIRTEIKNSNMELVGFESFDTGELN
jgi:hypothetical protein